MRSVPYPAIGALTVFVILVRTLVRRSRRLPFPPGPRPDPLIGNVRQMGSNDLKFLFEQWGKEYGEHGHPGTAPASSILLPGSIVYASAFGKPLVILNSFNVAQDLLQKRGNIYSSRPRLVTFSEMWVYHAPHPQTWLIAHMRLQDGVGIRTFPVVWGAQVPETPQNHTGNHGYPFRE